MSGHPIREDDLQAYVDDALDPARRVEVAAYLESHPDVAERVRGYLGQREELRARLGTVIEEPVPPELNLTRMIEARRRPPIAWWRNAAAAVLLLCTGAAGGWSLHGVLRPAPEGMAALAREAADSYAVYAPDHMRPVEIKAADQSELVAWATRRLQRPVAVPDLSMSGYRFMGGRIVATAHGPGVLFMYDNDHGTRLVMLSRLMATEKNAPMSQDSRDAMSGFTWADKGIGYSLVGPVAPETLRPIANEVRRQVDANA